MDMNIGVLLGAYVREIYVNSDQSEMYIDTIDGTICLEAHGDCCSETWFADFVGVEAFLCSTILLVERLPTREADDNRTRQQVDEVYGYRFRTANGDSTLVFRNSSNGYYGGSLDVKEIEAMPTGLTQIIADWSA